MPAEKKTPQAEYTTKNAEMVKVRIPMNRMGGDNSDVFVSVNGKNYLIQRGVDVEVPENVAEVLHNSEVAQDAAYIYAKGLEFQPPKP